jgi:hypothetical protein
MDRTCVTRSNEVAQDTRERVLNAEANFLIWLSRLVLADLDGHVPIEPFEEVQQLSVVKRLKCPFIR